MERTANGKRKSAGEAAAASAARYSIVPPRFISCKMIKTDAGVPRPVTPWAFVQPPANEASFASLPRELFCNIVAFLGPTSSSLGTLSQVTREHNDIMRSIGDVMLQRARLRFRTPLMPQSRCESSISLFVRHARVSKAVHDKLEVLNEVLSKDFPIISTDVSSYEDAKPPFAYVSQSSLGSLSLASDVRVEPSEVSHALNIALCLLGCPKQHFFDDPSEARDISKNAGTTALEWRVSSLCSKLGAKAYKYAKSRMCRRYEREDELLSAYAVSDEMPLEDDGSYYEDDQDASVDSSLSEADEDMAILDKASLVMQHIVLREQHKARQTGQPMPFRKNCAHTQLGRASFVHA